MLKANKHENYFNKLSLKNITSHERFVKIDNFPVFSFFSTFHLHHSDCLRDEKWGKRRKLFFWIKTWHGCGWSSPTPTHTQKRWENISHHHIFSIVNCLILDAQHTSALLFYEKWGKSSFSLNNSTHTYDDGFSVENEQFSTIDDEMKFALKLTSVSQCSSGWSVKSLVRRSCCEKSIKIWISIFP